ncbi:hypothetical protein QFZ68_004845 [Streptomyces sp. V1I6]|nr:hypothetical protein [Streptomyces sp. V1I6]
MDAHRSVRVAKASYAAVQAAAKTEPTASERGEGHSR